MKKAFISGASHGIGKAIARRLAAEGCHLALNCKNSEKELRRLCLELEDNHQTAAVPLIGDVGKFDDVSRMFAQAEEQIGEIDLLVNNAGISYFGLLSTMTPAQWQEILDTNLSSVFYCCRQAAGGMVRRKSGKILNISSVWGEAGASCEAAYSAAKGGVNALTRALAKELAPSNIQVNAIACGCIDTRMNARLSREERARLEEEIPAGRYGTPEETAEFAWQILSAGEYLTGQVIRLDGGWI